jgi:hypothetical protein
LNPVLPEKNGVPFSKGVEFFSPDKVLSEERTVLGV